MFKKKYGRYKYLYRENYLAKDTLLNNDTEKIYCFETTSADLSLLVLIAPPESLSLHPYTLSSQCACFNSEKFHRSISHLHTQQP
jgi:hypothetical protein